MTQVRLGATAVERIRRVLAVAVVLAASAVPAVVAAQDCDTSADCPAPARPICARANPDAGMRGVCAECETNSHCAPMPDGGMHRGVFCHEVTLTCGECNVASASAACATAPGGRACLPDGTCGCVSNPDCASSRCNTTMQRCEPETP